MPRSDRRSGVLVTGGTGALGRAVVRELLAGGRTVTATWIDPDERDELERKLGSGALALVEADLTEPEGAEAAVAAVGPSLGAVAHLVGGHASGPRVGESDPAVLDRMLRLNVRPLYLLARAAMPVLAEGGGGALVAVSARAAIEPRGGDAAYAASKAAVLALVKALHAEYLSDGVRSNAILPNLIDTPQNRAAMPHADSSRWTPPEQVARVVRFLVSEGSAPTSGAAVPVYGPVV